MVCVCLVFVGIALWSDENVVAWRSSVRGSIAGILEKLQK